MTDYFPKVGDRVTVAGDDREWEVRSWSKGQGRVEILGTHEPWPLYVLSSMLTPIPTPPPEPPVGSIVMAGPHVFYRPAPQVFRLVGQNVDGGFTWCRAGMLGWLSWDAVLQYGPPVLLEQPSADWEAEAEEAARLIDPADDAQVRDAGLCRVDEVRQWLHSRFRRPRSRFGGDGDD